MHENCYDVKLPCPYKEIVYKALRNGKQKGSFVELPFCFLSEDNQKPNFVHPLNQLASAPAGAIPPMKSTFLMKGRATMIGSSK